MKKNIIEINLENIENINTINFIQAEIAHCNQNKIRIEIFKDLNLDDCSGHFSDYPKPCLTVHSNDKIADWLPIFIHESCHKDQCLEQTDIWHRKIGNEYDALEIFDMWLEYHVELDQGQLQSVLDIIVQVELDCERRSVEKIKKYNLDINVMEYIQKANSYIWYYHAVAHTRKYSELASPYVNPKVWSKMPLDFSKNYSKIDSKLLKLFLKNCY